MRHNGAVISLFGYEISLLIPPLLAIGVPISAMLACFFKALWPRARTGLVLSWAVAFGGFAAGHLLASVLAWSFLAVGDVHVGPAVLGALLGLGLAPR